MSKQCRGVFVLGTDTEVGKTYQAAALAKHLRSSGHHVGVYKPVASGVHSDQPSDPEVLRDAAGLDCPIARVCPQLFHAACAPPVAAKLESKRVDEELLMSGARWWFSQCDFLIVEGVGGALAPLSETLRVLDLCELLSLPTVVIAANRLGVVNHTLLTLEAIAARGLDSLGVVLNDLPSELRPGGNVDESLETNASLLKQFSPETQIVAHITELKHLML